MKGRPRSQAAEAGCDLARFADGHLVASLPAARLLDGEEAQLRLSGQGLRNATRIAAGDADLRTDIIGTDAPAVAAVLAEAAKNLDTVRFRHTMATGG
ncbi:hypothetical protein AB0B50_25265 [Streptomyces sp. NPDC041068]|uniref:hypothetical protein n=1 Tax=Streptomyces sp. NPDC041068 TaxID=3155130 RepID=UPI0033D57938